MQLSSRSEVGRDEPVPVAVLEWFWHLRGDQEQQAAQRQQAHRRRGRAHTRQRPSAQAAQGEDLEHLDAAERGDGEEADRKQAGVDRDQELVRGQRRRRDGKRRQPEQSFGHRSRVPDPDICLVAPLLAALHDAVLRRAHEFATVTRGASQRDQRVERHSRPDHLAQQRGRTRPPRAPASGLGDHEADPR